jgi:invasion protein IalB
MRKPVIIALVGGVGIAAAVAGVLALSSSDGALRQAPQQVAAQPDAAQFQPTATAGERPTRHEEFADWAVICSEETGPASCAIVQNHVRGETRQRLFRVQLQRLSQESVSAVLITPLQVHLRQGIVLQVDDIEPVQITYSGCRPEHCQATAQLSNDFIGMLLRAQTSRAAYRTADGQTVTVNISVDGLADALAALERGARQ